MLHNPVIDSSKSFPFSPRLHIAHHPCLSLGYDDTPSCHLSNRYFPRLIDFFFGLSFYIFSYVCCSSSGILYNGALCFFGSLRRRGRGLIYLLISLGIWGDGLTDQITGQDEEMNTVLTMNPSIPIRKQENTKVYQSIRNRFSISS